MTNPARIEELTPTKLQTLLAHCQSLSRSKPRQTETILKLARAQLWITKALEPFEQAREDLLATLPPEPIKTADEVEKETYKTAKDEVDAKFRDIFLKGKFAVKFPPPISGAELQQFQDPPNPIDLAALAPYIVQLDDEPVAKAPQAPALVAGDSST
jgi:hypothetical protein